MLAKATWHVLRTIRNNPQAPEQLVALLGQIKGPLMKAGQVLAIIPGFLPDRTARILEKLCTQSAVLSPDQARRALEEALGCPWQDVFEDFQWQQPIAGSIGQVHKAQIQGQTAACKIQYPGMLDALQGDLKYLSFLCSLYECWGAGIATKPLQEEIQDALYSELDYTREAHFLQWFGSFFQDDPQIHIPTLYPHASRKGCLTMSWVTGMPIQEAQHAHQSMRDRLGGLLLKAWYKPFFQKGALHADPHMGNYTWTPQGDLNIVDFGCVRIFPDRFVQGAIAIYESLLEQRDTQEGYDLLGFENLTKPHKVLLDRWAYFLLAPFLRDKKSTLYDHVEEGLNLAGHIHKELRASGGVHIPRAFLLLDRSVVTLGSMLIRLKAEHNWRELFQSLWH